MAGEVGNFVVGTDVIGGSGSGGVAGGALPGTFATTTAVKPEPLSAARQSYVIPQVKPEAVS